VGQYSGMSLDGSSDRSPSNFSQLLQRLVPIALIVATLGLVWAATGVPSPATRASTVPCRDIILRTTYPYRTGGYRTVLGYLSVPPAYLRQVVPTRQRPWAYWRKAGLVVRAGAPAVTVSVPRAWRSRAAIMWGNGGGPASSLKIARCAGPSSVGNSYAGGFYLRTSAACVPILFGVGARKATVHFGVGRRC
jgi:hypothetical protein